ncbi:MAG: type IX secretion system membrane protein PorP/SprF [Bacteroidota bacterium]
MNRKINIILIGVLMSIVSQAQQIPTLNNYLINKFAFNPAVAGSDDFSPVRLHIKSQWMGFDKGAPKTQWLSGHTKIDQYGLGGCIFNDQYGSFRRIGINIAYSYIVDVGTDMKLAIGLAPNVFQFSIDQGNYVYFDDNDDVISGAKESSLIIDASAGLYFYAENYYAGISGLQLLQPKFISGNSNEKNYLIRNYIFIGGYRFNISGDITLEPGILIKYNEADMYIHPVVKGIYDDKYWFGLGYKESGALTISLGGKIQQYYIGYSFEYTMSEIANYSSGTHEIVLGIDLPGMHINSSASTD